MPGDFSQNEIDALLKNRGNINEKEEGANNEQAGDQDPEDVSLELKGKGPVVEKVEFTQLKRRNVAPGIRKPGLELFQNIPLVLSGELGKANITVRDLLKLDEGSVVKLEKMVGESATVLLNDQYLGQAEIVVINDRFGLRITAFGEEEAKEARVTREVKEAEEQAASTRSKSGVAEEEE